MDAIKRTAAACSLAVGLLAMTAPAWAEGYGVPSPPPAVGGVSFQAPPPVVVPVQPVVTPPETPVAVAPPAVLGEIITAPPAVAPVAAPSVAGLAFTGADIAELVGIGLAAIGVGFLLSARRRRPAVLL